MMINSDCMHRYNKAMMDLWRLHFKLRERVFLEKHMDPRSTELEAFIQEEQGTALKMSDVQLPKRGELIMQEQLLFVPYPPLSPTLFLLFTC